MLTLLRYVGIGLDLALVILLLRRRWARCLPWFTAWIAGACLSSVATLFVSYPSGLYNKIAGYPIPILTFLQLLAVLRCTQESLRGYAHPRQQRQAAFVVQSVGLAIVVSVVGLKLETLRVHPQWLHAALVAWRVVSWMGGAILTLVCLCAHLLPARLPTFISWHRNTLCMCCLWMAFSLQLFVLHDARLNLIGAYSFEIGLTASCSVWVWALLREPGRADDSSQHVPQYDDPVIVRYRDTMNQVAHELTISSLATRQ